MVTAKEVPPGGVGEIKAVFRSKGYNGPVRKMFTVVSNDPEKREMKLKLFGKVTSEVTAEPRYLNFGKVKKDQPAVPMQLKIRFQEGKNLRIKDIYSDSKSIVITKQEMDEKRAIFSVSLAERLTTGRHVGKIIVKTNSSKVPKVYISFHASVLGNVKLSPNALLFDWVQPGKPAKRIVTITKSGTKNFTIGKVKTISKDISTEIITEKEGERYKISAVFDPGSKRSGKISDRLMIEIKGEEEEVLTVPINGFIRERKKSHADMDKTIK